MRAVPPLIQALKDPEAKVRTNAVESLSFFPNEASKIVPVLLERLSDNSLEVRKMAILSLGRIGKGFNNVKESIQKICF